MSILSKYCGILLTTILSKSRNEITSIYNLRKLPTKTNFSNTVCIASNLAWIFLSSYLIAIFLESDNASCAALGVVTVDAGVEVSAPVASYGVVVLSENAASKASSIFIVLTKSAYTFLSSEEEYSLLSDVGRLS